VKYLPPVLDPASAARMMWFDKADPRAMFGDIRDEGDLVACDGRTVRIVPDQLMDFRDLPFPDCSFWHVVLDPPHLNRLGKDSFMAQKYGRLAATWKDDLEAGFAECFRVLRPGGTLIFKWNEAQIPIADVLALTPELPLYGHRSGRLSKTHWISFIKEPAL